VIWWHTTTSCINFSTSVDLGNPADDMFDDPLIKLMQDVGRDRMIDVDIRQIFPEWVNDRFNASTFACLEKASGVIIEGIQCLKDKLQFSKSCRRVMDICPQLVMGYGTDRTFPSKSGSCQNLFRIIAHKTSKEGMDPISDPISCCH